MIRLTVCCDVGLLISSKLTPVMKKVARTPVSFSTSSTASVLLDIPSSFCIILIIFALDQLHYIYYYPLLYRTLIFTECYRKITVLYAFTVHTVIILQIVVVSVCTND